MVPPTSDDLKKVAIAQQEKILRFVVWIELDKGYHPVTRLGKCQLGAWCLVPLLPVT